MQSSCDPGRSRSGTGFDADTRRTAVERCGEANSLLGAQLVNVALIDGGVEGIVRP